MAWVIKSIAALSVATGGWYTYLATDSDKLAVKRAFELARSAVRERPTTSSLSGTAANASEARSSGHLPAGDGLAIATLTPATPANPGQQHDAARLHRFAEIGRQLLSPSAAPATASDVASPRSLTTRGSVADRAGATVVTKGTGGSVAEAIAPAQVATATTREASPSPFRKPGDETRRRLASAIQTELRRVGCFAGTINGDWDKPTRDAMRAFNRKVNATLPLDAPDYILLTLLQGHARRACGPACRADQIETRDGTCQQRALHASNSTGSVTSPPLPVPGTRHALAITTATSVGVDKEQANLEAARRAQQRLAAAKAIADAERERQAAATRAKAEAQAEAARLAKLADAERQRLAALEVAKREREAATAARAERERQARLAAAEARRLAALERLKAEHQAQARTAALQAEREAAARAQAAIDERQQTERALIAAKAAQVAAAAADRPGQPAASDEATARQAATPIATKQSRRFVGGFVPPPTYRIGRLPPSPRPRVSARPRPAPNVQRARFVRRHNPQAIFRNVSRQSP